MKNILYKFLIVTSLIYLLVMYFLGKNSKKEVLSVSTTNTPPVVTFTQPPTATPTPRPTKTPTPKPTPTPASSQEVNELIDRFSGQYGLDPNVVRYIALCESGFKSNAVNWIYVGLFQFGPVTWKNLRAEIGEDVNVALRYSAEESVQTATYALSKGKEKIWPNCVP